MFDAKRLLEVLMTGAHAAQQVPQQTGAAVNDGAGGLGDLLGKALSGFGGQSGQGGQAGGGLGEILAKLGQQAGAQGGSQSGGGLGDLLGKALGGLQGGGQASSPGSNTEGTGGSLGDLLRKARVGSHSQPAPPSPDAASDDEQDSAQQGATPQGQAQMELPGGLGDLLKKLQVQVGGSGGLGDILGQVLGQATAGVSEGARKLDEATGASGRIREATGQSPEDILGQLKDWLNKNQGVAMAGSGGLGAVVLGTRAGRALTGKAIKLGSLALIGGLAYKALQNYQAGKPLINSADGAHVVDAAPAGSGYETGAVTHDSARLYIRAMIAAAAADGRLDPAEHDTLLASMKQAGIGDEAEEFLAKELNHPATVQELAAACTNEQEALQVFTAARVALDVDDDENKQFLADLGAALGIDRVLMQHIDVAASHAV